MIALALCLIALVFIAAYVRWVIRPERERPTPVEDYSLSSGAHLNFNEERGRVR